MKPKYGLRTYDIAQVVTSYPGDGVYIGTATLMQDKSGVLFFVTCAHNVVRHTSDGMKEPDAVWLYLARDGEGTYANKIQAKWFSYFPGYEKNPSIFSGCDFAIIGFDNDGFEVQQNDADDAWGEISDWRPDRGQKISVCGYPGSYAGANANGKLYGMDGTVASTKDARRRGWLITYKDLDTSGGQSGSAVLADVEGQGARDSHGNPIRWIFAGIHVGTEGSCNLATAYDFEKTLFTEDSIQMALAEGIQ